MSNEYFALDANVAALAQAFGEDMGDVKRRILKDATTFPTRVEMVAALPSLADSPDGRIVFANGEGYMRDRNASDILDMPGWKRWEPIPGVVSASDIVSYGEQSPNPAKQAQARQNLGLGTASTADLDDLPIKSFASRAEFVSADPQVTDGSVVSAAGYTYVRRGGSSSITDLPNWEPLGTPSPYHFGAVCDGVADDTEAMRQLHNWCNETGQRPSFSGVKAFAIQADAQIKINTDVDFNGAVVTFLDGMVPSPSWSNDFMTAYIVEDPDSPTSASTVPLPSSDYELGSYLLGRTIGAPRGYLYTQVIGGTAHRIPDRNGGTLSFRIAHKVVSDGKVQHPLWVDLSGGETLFYVVRPNSAAPLTISGLTLDLSQVNQFTAFAVERNEVTLEDFVFTGLSALPADSVNKIIAPYRCSDFTARRFRGIGTKTNQNLGTYIINMDAVANSLIEDCHVRGEWDGGDWSWQSSRLSNGTTFRNCDVDRIDIHAYSANYSVIDCTTYSRGLSLGQGGGFYKVKNLTYRQTREGYHAISTRGDYAGTWDGDLIVDGVHIIATASDIAAVNLEVGTPDIVCTFPRIVSIKNVTFTRPVGDLGNFTRRMSPLRMDVRDGSLGVTAPHSIIIDGVQSPLDWHMTMAWDLSSCLTPVYGNTAGCKITVTNCRPTFTSVSFPTLEIPAAKDVPRNNIYIRARFINVDRLFLRVPGITWNNALIDITNCEVARSEIPNSTGVMYTGCTFIEPLLIDPETAAPLATRQQPEPGGRRFNSIVGGRIAGDWDLTQFHGITGLLSIAGGIDGSVLPSGVSRDQLFTGWLRS